MTDIPPATLSDTLFRDCFSLEGKVALVTGASSGIGAHLARTLSRAGAEVVLTARRQTKLDALAGELVAMGAKANVAAMDVTVPGDVDAVMRTVGERHGRLDILINNSGVATSGTVVATAEADWDHNLDTNLKGVFLVSRAAVPLLEAGGGAIVNIASILGIGVLKGLAAYAASKAGVIALTRTMALELGPKGVRVNAIAPGYIETDMNRALLRSERGQRMIAARPLAHAGEPRDLDGALLMLAGPAGAFITGTTVVVDGGHLLAMGGGQ